MVACGGGDEVYVEVRYTTPPPAVASTTLYSTTVGSSPGAIRVTYGWSGHAGEVDRVE